MLSRRVCAVVLAACLALLAACKSGGAFPIFGGAHTPQAELVESVQEARKETLATQDAFAAAFKVYQRLTAPQAVELQGLSGAFEDAQEVCQDHHKELAGH